ncbi:MAG: MFS transporter [Clostridiaceae bacterium]|nr:MFS transporter [Clostridiaceae bacterium]
MKSKNKGGVRIISRIGVKIKTKYFKYKIFMFVYWAMMLSISGMYTMYIAQAGFSKEEISFTVTVFISSSIIGQNLFGYFADSLKCVKKILIFAFSIGIIGVVLLMFTSQRWFIISLLSLLGIFVYGTVPLSEAWYIEVLRDNGDQNEFGRIRGVGSIGYGVSGILLGILLQYLGWNIYKWYILISICTLLIVVLLIPESKKVSLYGDKGGADKYQAGNLRNSFKEALKLTFKVKPLRSIVVIVFIYSFVVKGIYSYLGVLVSDFGGGPLSLGFAYFFDASPEIITFILTSRLLRRYRSKDLVFAAFILQIVRLSLILFFNSPLSIIILGTISGFAYGLLATAYKTYIYEVAPDKYKISCLSLCESMIGLSGVISAPIFGLLIIKLSGYATIVIGLGIYVIMTLILAISRHKEKNRQKKEWKENEICI